MVVDKILHGVWQERPEPTLRSTSELTGFHCVTEHSRFGGEPRAPTDDVQDYGHDHDGEEGGYSVEEGGSEKGTGYAETAASKIINRNDRHAEKGHVVEAIPLDRQRQAQRDAGGKAPPAITHAGTKNRVLMRSEAQTRWKRSSICSASRTAQ